MKKLLQWNVRNQFLAAFLVTALVPFIAYLFFSTTQTSAALQKFERERILARVPALTSIIEDEAGDQLRFAKDFSGRQPTGDAVRLGDSAWLQRNVVDWLVDGTKVTGAQIVTPTGDVLTADGDLHGTRLWQLPEVQSALTGEHRWGFESIRGGVYLVTASPITPRRGGLTRGVLILVRPLNASCLAQLGKQVSADGIALFRGSREIAATGGASVEGLPALAPDGVASGEIIESPGAAATYVALRNSDGAPQAELRVAMASDALRATTSALGSTARLAFIAAVVIAVVVGLFVSRMVVRRLVKLANAAVAVASGAAVERIPVKRDDEIGRVATAFNEMAERVQKNLSELTGRIGSLATELANLNIFGETLSKSTDVHAELNRLAAMLTGMFGSDFAGVFTVEAGGARLAAFAGSAGATSLAAQELGEWAVAERGSITIASATADERLSSMARVTADGARSLMAVPLLQHGSVLGALCVGCGRPGAFEHEDLVLLGTVGSQTAVALENAETYRKLESAYLDTVKALAAAMEAKDHYTAEHADMLAAMAVAVGRRMGLAEAEIRRLQYAAVLHDIGKIGIPGNILNKPGKLTDAEFQVMAEHTLIGERIISRIDYLEPIARVIRSAHERWDGRGYPDHIAGDEIPLQSRILFVCDAFHAMTSDRPYRKALPVDEALEELRRNAGGQFDPQVVEAFLSSRDELQQEVADRRRLQQAPMN